MCCRFSSVFRNDQGNCSRIAPSRPDSTSGAYPSLHASSIGIQSTSAMYITTRLFPQLGIGDAMSPKITNGGAEQVAQGATEIAILPVSELLRKSGTDYVGMIPKEIQFASMF